MWPFRKGAAESFGFQRDASGEWAFNLTPEEQREVDLTMEAFKGYVVDPQHAEELRRGLTARGLSNYAVSCVLKNEIKKAFAAATKAYSIFQLPIYLYDSACFLEAMGRDRDAAYLFRKFLVRESDFKATPIEQAILADRDVSEAVKDAKTKIPE